MVIDIRNVHVERGGKHILKDITCGVPKGQIVGLIGPSGSGKTTLMRTIIGAQRIKSGTVLIMDEFAGDPSLRAHIGYMAQGNGVYANLSVMENLRYFARLLGVNRAGCEQVLRLVELEPQRTQTVATLSGGQQAR